MAVKTTESTGLNVTHTDAAEVVQPFKGQKGHRTAVGVCLSLSRHPLCEERRVDEEWMKRYSQHFQVT